MRKEVLQELFETIKEALQESKSETDIAAEHGFKIAKIINRDINETFEREVKLIYKEHKNCPPMHIQFVCTAKLVEILQITLMHVLKHMRWDNKFVEESMKELLDISLKKFINGETEYSLSKMEI